MRRTISLLILAALAVVRVGASAAATDPTGSAWAELLRGAGNALAGRDAEAVAGCDALLPRQPDNVRAHVLRGTIHLRRKRAAEALADFDAALRLNPDSAALHLARARAYRLTRDYDRALDDYTAAIRLDPTSAEAYAGRAGCYLMQIKNLTDNAVADYTAALRLNPTEAWGHCEAETQSARHLSTGFRSRKPNHLPLPDNSEPSPRAQQERADGDSQPPIVGPNVVYVIETPQFGIPIHVDYCLRDTLETIRIFVSEDQGKTWTHERDLKPTDEQMVFASEHDGLYWFATQEVAKGGRRVPARRDSLVPALKVRVSTPPRPQGVGAPVPEAIERLQERLKPLDCDHRPR